MKIAVLTDTNSGITVEEAEQHAISLIPMPFFIDGTLYFEGLDLSQEEFFEKQAAGAEISTSQPSPADVMGKWDQLLKDYDQIVYIPMSSGLSSSCESAKAMAMDYEGRVFVVDNKQISIPMKESVYNALALIDHGFDGAEIKRVLEQDSYNSHIFLTVSTLKHLKKGGRITPAAAAIGTALNIKPVLKIEGGKLDAFAKVRGMKQAEQKMLEATRKELEEHYAGEDCLVRAAYSGDPELGQQWVQKVAEAFPDMEVYGDPLALSIACHTGPGAYGIGCLKKLKI